MKLLMEIISVVQGFGTKQAMAECGQKAAKDIVMVIPRQTICASTIEALKATTTCLNFDEC